MKDYRLSMSIIISILLITNCQSKNEYIRPRHIFPVNSIKASNNQVFVVEIPAINEANNRKVASKKNLFDNEIGAVYTDISPAEILKYGLLHELRSTGFGISTDQSDVKNRIIITLTEFYAELHKYSPLTYELLGNVKAEITVIINNNVILKKNYTGLSKISIPIWPRYFYIPVKTHGKYKKILELAMNDFMKNSVPEIIGSINNY